MAAGGVPVTFTVNLSLGGNFGCEPGDILLDAARRQEVFLAHGCRNGRCGVCKARVLSGETRPRIAETSLTPRELSDGYILTCAREALSDVTLAAENLCQFAEVPVRTLPARLDRLENLSGDVLRVVLRLPPRAAFRFVPGQYIEVISPLGVRRSYSLASMPSAEGSLELHIRKVPGGVMSDWWFGGAALNDLVRFEGPFGTFATRSIGLEPIFLATGTGYAPVRAMLQQLQSEGFSLPVWLYWGGRRPADLYENVAFPGLDLRFFPVLSRAGVEWGGRRGYVQEAVLADRADLSGAVVYACGSDAMIQAAHARFRAAGLLEAHFFSDAFVASN